jgi:hypothetical protein
MMMLCFEVYTLNVSQQLVIRPLHVGQCAQRDAITSSRIYMRGASALARSMV